MIPSRASALALLFAAWFALPTPARADDTRAIEAARRSFDAGMAQYRSGDLDGARISLAQSFAAWPSVETLRNLAIAELNTDHVLDALAHFKMYVKDKNADPDFVKRKVGSFLSRCEERVGHLRVIAPPHAIVMVDQRQFEDLGEDIDVLPGTHTISAGAGDSREVKTVDVAAKQTADVRFQATTTAVASPGAESDAALAPRAEGAGRQPGGHTWTAKHGWVVALGAAAVVSAGVGLGFGLAANDNRSSIDGMQQGIDSSFCTMPANSGFCGRLRSMAEAQRNDAAVSNVAFGFAGALAVASVVVWVTWPKEDLRRRGMWWITPSVGDRSGGMVAAGRF
jgi:hypothetical protein